MNPILPSLSPAAPDRAHAVPDAPVFRSRKDGPLDPSQVPSNPLLSRTRRRRIGQLPPGLKSRSVAQSPAARMGSAAALTMRCQPASTLHPRSEPLAIELVALA